MPTTDAPLMRGSGGCTETRVTARTSGASTVRGSSPENAIVASTQFANAPKGTSTARTISLTPARSASSATALAPCFMGPVRLSSLPSP